MAKNVVVLHAQSNLAEAYGKMKQFNIRHLPVVDHEGRLLGMFSENDLNRAYPPRGTDFGGYYAKEELELIAVLPYMQADPDYLTPEGSLRDAALLLARQKIGAIPVVERSNRKLVGIVSSVDCLKQIAYLID